jgi:hypothetical protein
MLSEPRLLGLTLLGAFAVLGGNPSFRTLASAAKVGDSVVTCIQRVPATNKAGYERWIKEVSAPAFRRAGERFPSRRVARAAMRRFMPAADSGDSLLTYVYLWEQPRSPIPRETARSKKPGYPGIFEDAGMTEESSEQALADFKKLTTEAYCVEAVEAAVPTGR